MDADRHNPDDALDARVHRTLGESFADANVSLDAAWRAIGRGMDEPLFRGLRVGSKSRPYGVFTVCAAVVLLVIGFVVWRPTGESFRDIASAVGSRTTVTLRDGTRVILGPDSHVRIPRDFGVRGRTVNLDGEAYFAVVHDTRHPFTVLTRNLQIRDVGTEFDVRAYDDDIRVAVAQGSVVVGAGRGNGAIGYAKYSIDSGTVSRTRPSALPNNLTFFHDVSLSAGDMIDVINGVSTVTHHADMATLLAWQQGRLVFSETPLRDAVREISRTFGVTITVADSTLLAKRVTATFTGQTLDETLDEVTQIMGARYERVAHGIVIRRGLAASSDHPAPLTTARGLEKS